MVKVIFILSYPIVYRCLLTITVVLSELSAPPGNQPVVASNRGKPEMGYFVMVWCIVSIIAIEPMS
mgnify:CR=1 FL=1